MQTNIENTAMEILKQIQAIPENQDPSERLEKFMHILAAGFATKEDLDTISSMSRKINEIMCEFFASVGVELIDFKRFKLTSQKKNLA